MTKAFVAVRNVDEETFRKFKAFTIAERMKLGGALTLAMRRLLEEKMKRRKENLKKASALLKIKPTDFGPGSEHLSEQIDEILYGMKK